jgi:hypothetical protein
VTIAIMRAFVRHREIILQPHWISEMIEATKTITSG